MSEFMVCTSCSAEREMYIFESLLKVILSIQSAFQLLSELIFLLNCAL